MMTDDIKERLRNSISGPHKNGRPLTVAYSTKAETLLEAADRIEELEASNRRYMAARTADDEEIKKLKDAVSAERERLRPWLKHLHPCIAVRPCTCGLDEALGENDD